MLHKAVDLLKIIPKRSFLTVVSLDQSGRQPIQSLVQTVSGGGTTGLNVPLTVAGTESVQSKFVSHFGSAHGVGEILLVGKHEQHGIAEFVFVEHSVQFVAGGVDTIRVIGIDHEDESLSVLVVVAPQRTDFVLTTDVPDGERNVLVFDGFDIETDRGDRRNDCNINKN